MAMKENEPKIYRYGVFEKGGWKALVLAKTKEEAEKYIRGRKRKVLEVREIL